MSLSELLENKRGGTKLGFPRLKLSGNLGSFLAFRSSSVGTGTAAFVVALLPVFWFALFPKESPDFASLAFLTAQLDY